MSNIVDASTWDPIWDDIFRSKGWGRHPPEHIVRFIARTFSSVRDRSIIRLLEIGCGPGANIWFMAREGFSVCGIDGSATAIHRARQRLTEEGLTADLRIGDYAQFPWPDSTFDGAIENVSLYCNPRQRLTGRSPKCIASFGQARPFFLPSSATEHGDMAKGI